ncbi:MAG: aminotransferase class V-fold PLP-dependent enzyme [Deltaproteobacteria bacterium]|nr:aminotransferase class V-fold PLP-dependent enzyme [Deltaproteobacteria bacterium]
MDTLEALKKSFSSCGTVFLNNAGVAPITLQAKQAVADACERMYNASESSHQELFSCYNGEARGTIAALVGCTESQIVFFHTCAAAISQVALGIKLSEGDEILLWDQEYPSNAYPWYAAAKRAKAKVVTVSSNHDYTLDSGRMAAAINERTRVVAVSWVQYQSGAVSDLSLLSKTCREKGALLMVDAIQGLGVMPFDMGQLGVDIVAGGTHKWCCGPLGLGFLAIRKDLISRLEPIYYGAMSYCEVDEKFDAAKELKSTNARYEPGSPLLLSALGGAASIRLLLETGIENIWAEAMRLSRRCIEEISRRGFSPLGENGFDGIKSPIVTFKIERSGEIARQLRTKGVMCAGERAGGLRLSPHAFLYDDAIDRFFEIFDKVRRDGN